MTDVLIKQTDTRQHTMPPVDGARQFVSSTLDQRDAVMLFNKVNGVFARTDGDRVIFGLAPMVTYNPALENLIVDAIWPPPAIGTFIRNPYGESRLDEAEAIVRAADAI